MACNVVVLIEACILAAIACIAFYSPRGKRDWKHSTTSTIYGLFSIISLLLISGLVYSASSFFDWPDNYTIIRYLSFGTFALLIGLGVAYPSGLGLEVGSDTNARAQNK